MSSISPANPAPAVSIVVPTFNRRERLARLLLSLTALQADGASFEVVVCVDGSTDGTAEMLARYQADYPIRVLTQPNRGPAAARNQAVAAATGEVILFLDDDVVPEPGLIARHLAVHQANPRAVVIGAMLPPAGVPLAPWLHWEAATLQKQYDAMRAGRYAPTARQFYTANASVRRQHILAAGGFDARFTRAEDVELAYRFADAGLKFAFLPDAIVWHEPDRTFASWLRVPYEYGRLDVLMEQSCGRDRVGLAYAELGERHPINRLLPRWCTGHAGRSGALRATLGWLIRGERLRLPAAVYVKLASALYTLEYWRGVADASGTGHNVWQMARARHWRDVPSSV